MATGIKRLAKDTAIYGMSSILGKLLNWMLVPMYVRVLPNTADYGIVTNIYAWIALLVVLLTYGMETGFFRFINKKEEVEPLRVYTTCLVSLLFTSLLFIITVLFFLLPISRATGYEQHPEYIAIMGIVVAMDAFTSLPFAFLRYQGKAFRFALLKCINIFLNIILNIFFLIVCPWLATHYPASVNWFYVPDYGVGYIFISNLITTVGNLLLLIPEFRTALTARFDAALLKQILRYSFPLLLLGVAGIFNQTADKILFPLLFDDKNYANSQLGIYGACFKIGVVMVMFIQAFRYAYEPFIFAQNKGNNVQAYSTAMKYFIILSLAIFLAVMFYMDIFKHFVSPDYYPGLAVVPIVMLGEFFFGIYFNLSFWYKMIDQTQWGALFSAIGCIVTVSIILLFGPTYGYMACAWASFFCNLLMMFLSFVIGQKKYPIQYDYRSAITYSGLAIVLYAIAMFPTINPEWLRILYRTVILSIYIGFTIKRDLPLHELPVIGKYFK
ncbi:MAG: oligosaccharide flippase family protein [Tannerellaceae bacterium]|nr:oligosaccharide flippase family protein [Tannerellaceae bacterium]